MRSPHATPVAPPRPFVSIWAKWINASGRSGRTMCFGTSSSRSARCPQKRHSASPADAGRAHFQFGRPGPSHHDREDQTMHKHLLASLAVATMLAVMPLSARAETPQDQLVIGLSMTNLLTLDPAEA